MAIFYDPYCSQYAGADVNLREFSGIKFKSSMFADYYSGSCIDCSESVSILDLLQLRTYQFFLRLIRHAFLFGFQSEVPYYNSNSNMCNRMHTASARCTANLNYDLFDDSSSDHRTECSFIESVRFGTYNDKGEIYVSKSEFGDNVKSEVTQGQQGGLAIGILICCSLALYACYLHHSITNLLIKSLSHSHLLPPSRHRHRSKGKRSSSSNSSRGRQISRTDEDWDQNTGQNLRPIA